MAKVMIKTTFRFWVWWHDSPVRLTLALDCMRWGKPINVSWSEPHEEGYSIEQSRYWLQSGNDGQLWLYWEHTTGGRCCDGVLEHYTTLRCPVERLQYNRMNRYMGKPTIPLTMVGLRHATDLSSFHREPWIPWAGAARANVDMRNSAHARCGLPCREPDWEEVKTSQYDQYAQMAGY